MYVQGRGVLDRPLGGFGATSLEEFNASLAEGNRRWETIQADLSGKFEATVRPLQDVVSIGTELLTRLDYSSPFAFVDSVRALAASTGAVGETLSAVLSVVEQIAQFLLEAAPAYAVQFQEQHYAQVDYWIATRVLGIPSGDGGAEAQRKVLTALYGQGWVPIYSLNEHCAESGAQLGRWNGAVGIARTLEENRRLFSLIAGPRQDPLPSCSNVSDADFRDWINSDEGKKSIPIGEHLFDLLGANGFRRMAWSDHNAWAYVSDGLIFVNNLPHDIDPGYRVRNFYCNVILVNVTKLPDALLGPLADYVRLWTEAINLGKTDRDTAVQIHNAAFGPDERVLKAWNILRLVQRVLAGRNLTAAFAPTLAAVAARPSLIGRTGLDPKLVKKALRFAMPSLKRVGRVQAPTVPKTGGDESEKSWWKTPWPWVGLAAVTGIGYLIYRARKE